MEQFHLRSLRVVSLVLPCLAGLKEKKGPNRFLRSQVTINSSDPFCPWVTRRMQCATRRPKLVGRDRLRGRGR